MNRDPRKLQPLIFSVDVMLMYASLYLAMVLRRGTPDAAMLSVHFSHFSVIFAVWGMMFYTFGLYRIERAFDDISFMALSLKVLLLGSLVALGYFYLVPGIPIGPRTLLFLFVGIYAAVFGAWRFLLGKFRNIGTLRVGVGFVGLGGDAPGILSETHARPGLGYDVRFVLNPRGTSIPDGINVVRDEAEIISVVERTGTSIIVIGNEEELSAGLLQTLFGLLGSSVAFIRLANFYEMVTRRVPIGLINEAWFLENIDLRSKRPYGHLKRGVDIVLSLALLIITGPLWPFIALAVKLSGKGPVFFTQKRLGKDDVSFTMYKFRSMRVDENTYAPTTLSDPRITKVGNFLRKSRLDELPQMINILKGEMSFIGPRPERPEIAVNLEKSIPYYRQRHLVKPGVTGWDQVAGEYHSPSEEDTRKKLQYDLYYLKNMSLSLDVSIFFKTIMTVLRRQGR